jgi:hypothetical protein
MRWRVDHSTRLMTCGRLKAPSLPGQPTLNEVASRSLDIAGSILTSAFCSLTSDFMLALASHG